MAIRERMGLQMKATVTFQIGRLAVATLAVSAGFILGAAQSAQSQITQMYTFESPGDLEGFMVNGALSTISLNTNPAFASQGVQSLKWDLGMFASFEGAQTTAVDPAILNDPPGVDFIRFDFINTKRFVPDPSIPGTTPTFASISVNVFGEFASNPGVIENIQFFGSEVPVGALEPGTHELDIDLTGGGLLIGTSTVKGFNDYIADGLTVSSFQFYLNKNVGFDPTFEWTVYLDNIRAGRESSGGNGGDYNGDGTVNAADYTVWRDHLGGSGPSGDGTTTGNLLGVPDGVVNEWDYSFWKQEFGKSVPGSGGGASLIATAVPEPGSVMLLLFGMAGWSMARSSARKRT
ncbi:MAG: PEP-CTERM sorting domain-containing protein [Pirellulales bacterium]